MRLWGGGGFIYKASEVDLSVVRSDVDSDNDSDGNDGDVDDVDEHLWQGGRLVSEQQRIPTQ